MWDVSELLGIECLQSCCALLVASHAGKKDIKTIGPVIPQILPITRPRNRGTVLQPISWFELSAFCAFCDATGGIGGRELEAQRHALILRAGMST